MKIYTPLRYPFLEQKKEIKKLKEIIHKLNAENKALKEENKELKNKDEGDKENPHIREDFENWRHLIRDNY